MGNATSKLSIVIAGDNKGASKAIKATAKDLSGLKGSLSGVGAGLSSAMSGLASPAGLAAAAAGATAFGKKAVSDASSYALEVSKVSRVTGVAAKDASLLAFASNQVGISTDKAATAFAILSRNIYNGKLEKAGVQTKDASGKYLEFDEILGNVSDEMASLAPGAERTAFALKVLGRGGADMVKMLGKGSEALEAQREEMQKYGLEFDEAGLEKYKKYVATQRDMKAAMLGVEVAIADKVLPVLNMLGDAYEALPVGAAKGLGAVASATLDSLIPFAGFARSVQGLKDDLTGGDGVTAATEEWASGMTAAGEAAAETEPKLSKAEQKLKDLATALDFGAKYASDAETLFGAQESLADSTDSVTEARKDLAEVNRAAAGDSDEYRAAVKEEQDHLRDLADDERAVGEAKMDAADAQRELTEARVDAAEKVEDLRQAVVRATQAERDSVLALHEAEAERRRVLADPRSSSLDKERANVALINAREDVTQAQQDKAQAQREASRATIEGDEGVISAKKRVVDATTAVGAAERKVAETRALLTADGVAKSLILQEAAGKRKEAEDRVNTAILAQAQSFRDVVVAQDGPIKGLENYAGSLEAIYKTLDPASPLAQRVAGLMQSIRAAIAWDAYHLNTPGSAGGSGSSGGKPSAGLGVGTSASGTGDITDRNSQIVPNGGVRPPGAPRRSTGNAPNINITVNGTTRQAARELAAAGQSVLDLIVRGGR